jgi:hypothetical protein
MTTWGEGIHEIPEADYHWKPTEHPCLSASVAKILLWQSPGHVYAKHPGLNPDLEREARGESKFDLGTACHQLVLENKDDIVVISADSFRGKEAKALRDLAYEAGKVPLLTHQYEAALEMAEALKGHLSRFTDRAPFIDGKPEQSIIWREGDLWFKARTDWLQNDFAYVDDYKTTASSAEPESFARRMLFQMRYDIQAAFYTRGIKALTGVDPDFRFIVQETEAPYAVSVLALDPAAEVLAEKQVQLAIDRWSHCLSTGEWPYYPEQTCFVSPPPWLEAQVLEMEETEEAPPTIFEGRAG